MQRGTKLGGSLRSNTMRFNAFMLSLVGIIPLVESILPDVKSIIPENIYGYLLVACAVGNKILRATTTKALEDK